MDKWQAGDYEALWTEMVLHAPSMQAGPKKEKNDKKVSSFNTSVRRAKRLASEGLFGRACEALTSNGLHDKSDNIVDTLKALHPQGAPVAPHAIELPEVDEFDITAIKAALDSFPKLAGGGRSGLRPQHHKDAAGCKSPIVE